MNNYCLTRFHAGEKVFYRGSPDAPQYSTGDRTTLEANITLFEDKPVLSEDDAKLWMITEAPR